MECCKEFCALSVVSNYNNKLKRVFTLLISSFIYIYIIEPKHVARPLVVGCSIEKNMILTVSDVDLSTVLSNVFMLKMSRAVGC